MCVCVISDTPIQKKPTHTHAGRSVSQVSPTHPRSRLTTLRLKGQLRSPPVDTSSEYLALHGRYSILLHALTSDENDTNTHAR
jgi:hypothetical protein